MHHPIARYVANHIVICVHDFSRGGSERIAIGLARHWVEAGRKVTFLCGTTEGGLRDAVDPRVAVVALDPPIRRSLISRFWLGRAMAAKLPAMDADVVFLPGNFHFILAQALKRVAPQIPVVAKVSNPLLPKLPRFIAGIVSRLLAISVRPIDTLVYMTPELAGQGKQHLPGFRSAIVAEPNLPRGFVPSVRKQPDGVPLIIIAGRMERQKNLALALRAFAKLLRDRPAQLLVLGEGSERPKLEALVRKLGISTQVSMPGYLPDVHEQLAGASALLMTSLFEGYPAIVVEALAADVPVVTTDCTPSLHQLIVSDLHGMIVKTATPGALAQGLGKALDLPFFSGGVRQATVARSDATVSGDGYLDVFDRTISEQYLSAGRGKASA